MRFHQFVLERGPPFRVCDLFDEAYDVARVKAQPLVPQFVADVSFPDVDYEAFVVDFTLSLDRIAQKFMENVRFTLLASLACFFGQRCYMRDVPIFLTRTWRHKRAEFTITTYTKWCTIFLM